MANFRLGCDPVGSGLVVANSNTNIRVAIIRFIHLLFTVFLSTVSLLVYGLIQLLDGVNLKAQ